MSALRSTRYRYALYFALFGAAFLLIVAAARRAVVQVSLYWLSGDFLLLAIAYAAQWPGVYGKRASGRLNPLSVLLMAPLMLVARAAWNLSLILVREPRWDQVAPGLYVGGYTARKRLPADLQLVVDMTAEFPGVAPWPPGEYRSLPTLDGCVPPDDAFWRLAKEVANHTKPGAVFIHCASGHGRSVTLMVAVFLLRGLAKDVDDALCRIQDIRPTAQLNQVQRALLERGNVRFQEEGQHEGRE